MKLDLGVETVIIVTGARDEVSKLLPRLKAALDDPEVLCNKEAEGSIRAVFESLIHAAANLEVISSAVGHPSANSGVTLVSAAQFAFPWFGCIVLPPGLTVEDLTEGLDD